MLAIDLVAFVRVECPWKCACLMLEMELCYLGLNVNRIVLLSFIFIFLRTEIISYFGLEQESVWSELSILLIDKERRILNGK